MDYQSGRLIGMEFLLSMFNYLVQMEHGQSHPTGRWHLLSVGVVAAVALAVQQTPTPLEHLIPAAGAAEVDTDFRQ